MQISTMETAAPVVRYRLKAKIIESGYRTFTEFADTLNIHRVYLSQVLNGRTFPSPGLQKRIAQELGLTIKEVRELL